MSENQFNLVVKDAQVNQEDGFFFLAAPFKITVVDTLYHCVFEGNDHQEAEFRVYLEDEILVTLDHPYYLPDEAPETFFKANTKHQQAIMCCLHAFLQLEIAKGSDYAEFLSKHVSKINYSLSQPKFYSATSSS